MRGNEIMKSNEAGFSYIDTLIGMTIMLVGLLALAGTIAASVVRSRQQEQQLIAKQYATSTLESITSARDLKLAGVLNGLQNGWDSIGNVGSNVVSGTARGVFLIGPQSVTTSPGTDQVIGTADDNGAVVTGLTRQIVITDVCDPDRPSYNCSPAGTHPIMMRRIQVTIYYSAGRTQLSETVMTSLTKY